MNRMNLVHLIVIVAVGLTLPSTTAAQQIGVDGESGDTLTRSNNKRGTTASNRIIPPEEFGKYRKKEDPRSQLSQDALIEKLRADSASMRIHFRETLNNLRADSRLMRRKIKKLKKKREVLRRKINRLRASNRSGTQQRGPTRGDTPVDLNLTAGTVPASTEATVAAGAGTAAGETSRRSTLTKDASLNPNTASLDDLKAVPGLSDRLAERLEWYRREVRPFENLQDVRRVPGIDDTVFEKIKPYFSKGPY